MYLGSFSLITGNYTVWGSQVLEIAEKVKARTAVHVTILIFQQVCIRQFFMKHCWCMKFTTFLLLFFSGQRYSSRGSGLNQSDSLLSGGSVGQLTTGGGGVYLPDYSVRQLTDLQIIKVTNRNTPQQHTEQKSTSAVLPSIKCWISCTLQVKLGAQANNCTFKPPVFNLGKPQKCLLLLCCCVCLWYVLILDSDWTQTSCLILPSIHPRSFNHWG